MCCHHPLLRRALVGFALLCMGAMPTSAGTDCTLRVGWDEWPPYITRETGTFSGLEYEFLTGTAQAAGCKLDLLQVPWARALRMLGDGELDLLYGAGYSEERAKFAKFSIPYRHERFVLITKTRPQSTAAISLTQWVRAAGAGSAPRLLGVFRGNDYGEQIQRILKENAQTVTLVELNRNDQMIEMLKADRLDGYIVEDVVGQLQLQDPALDLYRSVIWEQAGAPLHYMFGLAVPDAVVERFNAAIGERLKLSVP